MTSFDESNKNALQEIYNLVSKYSKLKVLGFRESYYSTESTKLIYDSEWCRVNIVWGGWDSLGGNSIHIYYGRLHAPNEAAIMLWEGEDCHAWHDFTPALYFLDGLTPASAVALKSSHQLIDRYYEEEVLKEYHQRQPEWLMKMHVDVWDYYGVRLFELFDLRRPEIWMQYRLFLKEYYDIKGRRKSIVPSLDKVC